MDVGEAADSRPKGRSKSRSSSGYGWLCSWCRRPTVFPLEFKLLSETVNSQLRGVPIDKKKYQLAPNFFIRISREGDRFFGQATGQERFEIFAETDADFFFEVVDAQITFVKDDKGQVTHLVLHQNKMDQQAKKIK